MRILAALAAYLIFVHIGSDILGFLGLDIGEDFGMSYLSGATNFSISGIAVSFVIGFIAAAILIILDEDGIALFLAGAFWVYQIYGDYDDMAKSLGWLGFFLLTLDNIIKLATLIITNAMKENLLSFYRDIKRNSDDNNSPPEI